MEFYAKNRPASFEKSEERYEWVHRTKERAKLFLRNQLQQIITFIQAISKMELLLYHNFSPHYQTKEPSNF